ncbi:RCC1 domain-containing protein [Streptomyces sp. R35]|uniref:RCC1 domain-containing protein n=1 Tax=Streptomyces sp. R35 TaxID=3238630 RepID=A0AB39SQ50_9ACTN
MQLHHTQRRSAVAAALLALLATLVSLALPVPVAAAPAQRVEAWGLNNHGQVGDTTTTERHTAITVDGLTAAHVTALAGGSEHSLALLSNGTVRAWGYNFFGQLGDGTTTEHPTPGAVGGLSSVIAIAAGCTHSVALLSNGTVRAWGDNTHGQLGNGTTGGTSTIPVTVIDPSNPSGNLTGVTAIAAGCDLSVALLSNGTVRAWGNNGYGQLGNGTTGGHSNVPVVVSGLTGAREIACGGFHSLARMSDGTVRAWGDNSYGQLGNGTDGGVSNVPVVVKGLTGARQVSGGSGGWHSLARLSDGTVRAWGNNAVGQLGNGTDGGISNVPVVVSGLTGARDIAAGNAHSVASLADGTVRAWGFNGYGELGNGATGGTGSDVPVNVAGVTGIREIAAGYAHSLAA